MARTPKMGVAIPELVITEVIAAALSIETQVATLSTIEVSI
jgi:hypothetical protein